VSSDIVKQFFSKARHVTAESYPSFSHSLLVHGPDMLLESPTQILTQFVSLWTGHVTAQSHPNYYTICLWAKQVTADPPKF